RSAVPDVSASGLIAATLFALAVVAALFVLMTEPATPGAASVVPAVAIGGIAIVVLVRGLRRGGRARARRVSYHPDMPHRPDRPSHHDVSGAAGEYLLALRGLGVDRTRATAAE